MVDIPNSDVANCVNITFYMFTQRNTVSLALCLGIRICFRYLCYVLINNKITLLVDTRLDLLTCLDIVADCFFF